MYTLDDTMFTAEELLWMFGTVDTERNAHPNPMARWPGSGNSEYIFSCILIVLTLIRADKIRTLYFEMLAVFSVISG